MSTKRTYITPALSSLGGLADLTADKGENPGDSLAGDVIGTDPGTSDLFCNPQFRGGFGGGDCD